MPSTLISHLLLRAPLLPLSALEDPARALAAHPLGPAAIALASPDLHAGLLRGDADAQAALGRYARRAAFRPTPVGLLAGVAAGRLGDGTRVSLGEPVADVQPTWGRLAALGRALLEEPRVRASVRLRRAPSLLRSGESLCWLALGRDGLEEEAAIVDDTLEAVLSATERWTSWPTVRRRLRTRASGRPRSGSSADIDPGDLDDFLLGLLDGGLLVHDLTPPLVGEPAMQWMIRRLGGMASTAASAAAAELQRICGPLADRDLPAARAALAALPGAAAAAAGAPDLHGVLSFPSAEVVVDRSAVERAAALAPLLFRLQEATAGPVAERALDPALHDRLRSIAEIFGAGAYDPAALATGAHGLPLSDGTESARVPTGWPTELLSFLTERLLAAAAAGEAKIVLQREELEALLPAAPVPATFELFLTPDLSSPASDQPPGSGWLLGLHGPAGASFGRFAAAPGAPAAKALAELLAAESARPGEQRLDVIAAPSMALADLSAHPPLRPAALALSGWPSSEQAAVTPGDLQVVLDEGLPGAVGLRVGDAGQGAAVAPSPLHRVRSQTVPPGLYRLLAGWSFCRQHAPWLFGWGPLAGLPFLPRLVLEGFVLSPASWRLPGSEDLASDSDLERWREHARVPAAVQIGQGDELLPVDLTGPGARADLVRAAAGRVHEIWPPVDRARRTVADGRRVEAVVAVVAEASVEERATAARIADAGPVPPPEAGGGPAPGWRTFRIYGPADAQDAVLHEAVAPVVSRLRRGRWFFIRYEEPGTGRPHLRLRVQHGRPAQLADVARRLERSLSPLRSAGLVVTVEEAEYFRETARYGGARPMDAAEAIFQAGSELVIETLSLEASESLPLGADRRPLFARAADALTVGLGLDLPTRLTLAESRRSAHVSAGSPEDPAWRVEFRAIGRWLEGLLSGREEDAVTAALSRYRDAARSLSRPMGAAVRRQLAESLPALLHTQAVRMLGVAPEDEQAGYVFWARALAASRARSRRSPAPSPTSRRRRPQ